MELWRKIRDQAALEAAVRRDNELTLRERNAKTRALLEAEAARRQQKK